MVRLWPHPGPLLPSGLPKFGSPRGLGLGLGGPALWQSSQRRALITLGIETSCDDTCVSVINTAADGSLIALMKRSKVTCANKHHRGIHPVEAVESHTRNLAKLAQNVLKHHKPDLIAVTRGPGMKSCLSVGISFAKALSVACRVPLVGVHHMQAHALSIQLDAQELAISHRGGGPAQDVVSPEYPFLTLLVSGGHTMLVLTKSAIEHRVLASTQRGITNPSEKGKGSATAVGEMLDKCARDILPPQFLPGGRNSDSIVYAHWMEIYCKAGVPSYSKEMLDEYKPPQEYHEQVQVYHSKDGSWSLPPPLRHTKDMTYDFTGLGGKARAIMQQNPDMQRMERMELAYHTMRLAFEHLMSRVILALENDPELLASPPQSLVIAGGVASNMFLRNVAASVLQARGFGHVDVRAPRHMYCTDNAAMIAWAGQKMYTAGWTTDLSFLPQDEWPIEEILTGVDCWVHKDDVEASEPEPVTQDEGDQIKADAKPVPGPKPSRDGKGAADSGGPSRPQEATA
ncbi:hypothetical protein KVR01_005152 [Diaporthe batatas]|uniref:uncharacterized protein n=1 Tax=Diaporthe batatas TaxID=748121 RepID=UPI001D04FEA5|nr:uncharacterized protein KVR01_005152 [Diaporthe batatas]KAG8164877.1 hypothetical protein KVR01_005152 [Diaporthe batatas]